MSNNLAVLVRKSWFHVITTCEYNIKNSYEFVNNIQNATIQERYILAFLDVSLFTNIQKTHV